MPRRIHLALAALAALAAVVACVEPEPEPIEPTQARIGNPLDASIESLVDGHVSFGDGLSDYSFLYSTEDGLFHQAPGEEDPRALGTEAGALSGATEFSDGSLLVAGSEGLFSIWSGTLLASPLQSTLAPLGAARVLATPGEGGDDLWLMAEEQTHIWSEGSLYTLSPGGLQFAARETAWGAPVDGKAAFWVATDDTLYSIRFDDGLVAALAHREDTAVSALAIDGYASVWVAADDYLWRRWPDNSWDWIDAPFLPTRMASVAGSADLWIETDEGLWNQAADIFSPVEGTAGARLLGVDGAGRAIAATESGLIRVAAGRPLLFLGMSDGSELVLPTTVRLLPTLPSSVVTIDAALDGASVDLDEDWSILFDPLLLEDGAHELVATVTYEDDEEASGSLFFSVGEFVPPTWTEDIEPLFQQHCALCHLSGSQATTAGGGHPIDTIQAWQTEIESIIEEVETQRMPLNNPPLSPAEIQLIKSWVAGGFLE